MVVPVEAANSNPVETIKSPVSDAHYSPVEVIKTAVSDAQSNPVEAINSTVNDGAKAKKRSKRKRSKGKKAAKEPNQATDNNGPKLTPYQGPRRTCGMFHCTKCKKEWFSANSWANCFQKCNKCNGQIYPYRQFPPWPGKGTKQDIPPHPKDLCQKCQQLGSFCGRFSGWRGPAVVKEEEGLTREE